MIIEKAPGKLYIAGEYAVVEKGYPAIIMAVNKYVTVKVSPADNIGTLHADRFADNLIHWGRENSEFFIESRETQLEFIISAIKVVESYARSLNREMSFYNIDISSELDSSEGRKYGLGSSAAVTVATVKALSKYYKLQLNNNLTYKLAAIAHLNVQGNGSLGDIASSVFGGIIYYTSPDRNWVLNSLNEKSLFDVVNDEWPDLKIKSLTLPSSSRILVGWTGKPASTSILVDQVNYSKAEKAKLYSEFLSKSKTCLENMLIGFSKNDFELISKEIKNNRKLLLSLSKFTKVSIETPLLQTLVKIAEKYSAAAKTSGAGGGDCGVALVRNKEEIINKLINEWSENGIEYLNLSIVKEF